MKFKVLKGTELFDKLIALSNEMIRCNRLAFDLVKELGYEEMRGKFNTLAGGISSIVIKEGQPKGWRKSNNGSNEYFPSKLKANKELLDKINSLPVVIDNDLNKILNFDNWGKRKNERVFSFHPAIDWKKNFILIDVSSNYIKYKPVEGMIEILDSEYQKLSAQK